MDGKQPAGVHQTSRPPFPKKTFYLSLPRLQCADAYDRLLSLLPREEFQGRNLSLRGVKIRCYLLEGEILAREGPDRETSVGFGSRERGQGKKLANGLLPVRG